MHSVPLGIAAPSSLRAPVTRRVAGARSEDGGAIAKGTEVMVTRYDKGIAYVRPWIDPADELEAKA